MIEVEHSDLVGQYVSSTTEKPVQKSTRRDEAYRLIQSAGGKDFGREAVEELMAVMEDINPIMTFAGHETENETFFDVNPGPDYSAVDLAQIFQLKEREKGFSTEHLEVKKTS